MFVVMNELHIPKEAKAGVQERFGKSAENMKNVPGCVEFMFLNNEKEDGKQVVFTKWESKEAYEAWVNSDAFKRAHGGKSNKDQQQPPSNELNAYEVVYHTE